jgi:hypothetical protein
MTSSLPAGRPAGRTELATGTIEWSEEEPPYSYDSVGQLKTMLARLQARFLTEK